MGEDYTLIHNIFTSKKINSYAHIEDEDLVELVIPEGITHIEERAFSKCKNLKRVVFPESLEYIGPSAFSECSSLEEIIIPKNIKKIHYRTFADCKKLKKVIIPEGVHELDWAVFSGCKRLEEVVLPESVKKIGNQLFLNCQKLKSVSLPQNLKSLPDECFKGCSHLEITLNPEITKLGDRTFEDCHSLSTFPENVISFGNNCFKNCRSLTCVVLNSRIEKLPDGMFDGCIYLNEIDYKKDQPLEIGKKCFRNCKSLDHIPRFVSKFNERAFENCTSLTSIDIIDHTIPTACFRGCIHLREILNQDQIYSLSEFAFSGCESLEEMDIINASVIPAEAFSHCKNLKTVRLNMGVHKIGSRAFFNCSLLSDIHLPDNIRTIKKEAFKNCNSIKEITIPGNLTFFEDGAFSYMDSLEAIYVSPDNKTFVTPDHKILIHNLQQSVVLYAIGCKDKSYSFKDYNIQVDILNHEVIRPINGIGVYAFAGAKNLEELTVCACTQNIEASAFVDCANLKTLHVEAISLFTCPGFHIRERGRYFSKENAKMPIFLPFETVTFSGDLVQIFPQALEHFVNVNTLILPNDKDYGISENSFSDCILLEKVNIPKEVIFIGKNAFPPHTRLIFENGLMPSGLVELIHNTDYIGDYKQYTLGNGIYYIEQGNQITTITQTYIDGICSHPEAIHNNPVLFLDFMNDLIQHDLFKQLLFNGILMANMSLENREILIQNIHKEDEFAFKVLKHSGILDEEDQDTKYLLKDHNFQEVVDFIELLRKYNITDPILYHKIFVCCIKPKQLEHLISDYLPLFLKSIKLSHLLEPNPNEQENSSNQLSRTILSENSITQFIQYAEMYQIKDQYLFQRPIIAIANDSLAAQFFKVFDANIKRLIKASGVMDGESTAKQNLSDLLILLKITGALEDDSKIRQKASTFISEKMFPEILPNQKKNGYQVVGDDIHRIFNFPYTRDEFDLEFANFFLENYYALIEEERQKSGFIQRVYLNFREISKTCTSDKGSQRKLKVTIDKCKNYLSNVKFDGVKEEDKDFADLIGNWYDENSVWLNAQKVHHESLKAPRNIFTKATVEDEQLIYDNNPENDLREEPSPNYSFEWLPKQDYDNLILGKYCSCCAHINGAGQGIMRASIILDNCQNLVIRNGFGEIISKVTLYVNKEQGYAVFNTVETSLNYRESKEAIEKIYAAFLRGTEAFLQAYNKNNPQSPITMITIGTNRNTLKDYLTDEHHPEVEIHPALEYGRYSLNGSGYTGDWKSGQRLVLKLGGYNDRG